jgi:hypothetical protein
MHKYDPNFRLRRIIVKICIGIVVFSFIYCFLFIAFGTDQMRLNIKEIIAILLPLDAFATGIIITYMTSVHYDDKHKRELCKDGSEVS